MVARSQRLKGLKEASGLSRQLLVEESRKQMVPTEGVE